MAEVRRAWCRRLLKHQLRYVTGDGPRRAPSPVRQLCDLQSRQAGDADPRVDDVLIVRVVWRDDHDPVPPSCQSRRQRAAHVAKAARL